MLGRMMWVLVRMEPTSQSGSSFRRVLIVECCSVDLRCLFPSSMRRREVSLVA